MPLPAWAATAALGAIQNPEIQNAVLGVGKSVLGGTYRAGDYIARGAGNLAQNAGTGLADRLGALGQQYLPQSVNNAGGYARQGLGYLSGGVGGLYNFIHGDPQQQGMQQGGMGGMQGMNGQQGQMTPQEQLQQYYQQGLMEDNLGGQQQQLQDQYNRQLGQLSARFGGNLNNGAFRRASTGALGNLHTNLAALGEQSRMNRLGQIGGYLGNQQQLGLGARQLAQAGTIAQRQDALQQLGAMGGFGQQQQGNYMNQLYNRLNAQGNLGNLANGQAFQNVQVAGQVPWWQQMAGAAGQAAGQGIRGGIAYGTGGLSELNRAFNG